MNQDQALARQLDAYRRMTCEQRLEIALGLHELACGVAREGIRLQHPQASPGEVEQMLRKRLELARA